MNRNSQSQHRAGNVARKDFLLARMRVLSLDLKLGAVEVDSVGTALKGGIINEDQALEWLEEAGLLIYLPEKVRAAA